MLQWEGMFISTHWEVRQTLSKTSEKIDYVKMFKCDWKWIWTINLKETHIVRTYKELNQNKYLYLCFALRSFKGFLDIDIIDRCLSWRPSANEPQHLFEGCLIIKIIFLDMDKKIFKQLTPESKTKELTKFFCNFKRQASAFETKLNSQACYRKSFFSEILQYCKSQLIFSLLMLSAA